MSYNSGIFIIKLYRIKMITHIIIVYLITFVLPELSFFNNNKIYKNIIGIIINFRPPDNNIAYSLHTKIIDKIIFKIKLPFVL